MDLLAENAPRQLARAAARGVARLGLQDDFPRGDGGRMVIAEEESPARRPAPKRRRGGGLDARGSDDSDFDDLARPQGQTAANAKSVSDCPFVQFGHVKHCLCCPMLRHYNAVVVKA